MTISYPTAPLPLAEHQYAVIDRMRVPTLPEGWPHIELVSPMLAPQAHLYPWLVPLHELPSAAWHTLIADLSQHSDLHTPPMSALLLSSARTPQAVRNALVAALHFKDEHQKGHILRYYDPRVLFHLHWMLSPWQLANYLPTRDIPHWTFWLEGHWHTLAFTERVSFQPGESTYMPLKQLQRSGQINQVLAALPGMMDMVARQEVSRKIDALLERALTLSLPTQEDRITFALHGLRQRDAFWTAPKMAAFLAQARQIPDFYRDETRRWDEQRWLDMTHPQPRHIGRHN